MIAGFSNFVLVCVFFQILSTAIYFFLKYFKDRALMNDWYVQPPFNDSSLTFLEHSATLISHQFFRLITNGVIDILAARGRCSTHWGEVISKIA
jgi:hypothetical protein